MISPSRRSLVVLPVLLAACAGTLAPSAPSPDADVVAADAAVPDAPARADAGPSPVDAPPTRVDAPSLHDRVPVANDVLAPSTDAMAPTPCDTPRLLASGERVTHAAITPVPGGYVLAWVRAEDGATVVRGYDLDLTPQTPELPLDPPAGRALPDALTLSFSGDTGVVAAGSSLHVLTRRADALQRASTVDLSPRVARLAWVQGPSDFRAVTDDTGIVFTNGARVHVNTANNPRVDPIGPGASVLPTSDGGYLALEDAGGRFRLRSFITGHGVVLQARDEAADGVSASRVLPTAGGLLRLVSQGAREVDVALEIRAPETLALRAVPVTLHADAAWNRATGALALADDGVVMAWSAKPPSSGFNNSVQVQWGVDGRRAELFRADAERDVRVLAAAVAPGAARAWVLFGEHDPSGAQRLRARCVTR